MYCGGYVTGLLEATHSPHWSGWLRMEKDSDIPRARSKALALALKQPVDSFLFIDDDIVFRRDDFDTICQAPADVVGGVYVKREHGGTPVFYGLLDTEHPEDKDMVQVRQVGTGFLRITRRALERLEGMNIPRSDTFTHYFNNGVRSSSYYYSEDYAFCDNCWTAGVPVWMHRRVRLGHYGPDIFAA